MNFCIEVNNITKAFHGEKVLTNLSIKFEKGKIYGIIGRNGSGKSVFLKCICGILPTDSGNITVNGAIIDLDLEIPKNIGVVLDTPGFLPMYSGYTNLSLLARLNGKADKEMIQKSMFQVGLDPHNKKKVGQYSLGMKQRLSIAQALMESPDIILLDEPMNGLDQSGIENIRNLLHQYREEGVTIIIATHVKEDIDNLCDIVYNAKNDHFEMV